MITKGKIITILGIVALVFGAVMVLEKKKASLDETPEMRSYAMVVSSIKSKNEYVELSLPYLALVQSDKNVALSSRISARIEWIVKCGKTVKKDELLVRLDTKDLKAKKQALALQIDSAKAEVTAKKSALLTAQESHERTKKLLEVKGASQESFEKEASVISGLKAAVVALNNQVKVLKTEITQIQTSLSYANLRSPIEGVVSQCFANRGDLSAPTKPLLNIQSENGKYLLVRSANDNEVKALRYEKKQYSLHPMQNIYNGLHEYRAYLNTPRSSEERVDVSLLTYAGKGIYLPLDALLQKEHKNFCFVIEGEKAKAVEVEIIAQGVEGVVVSGIEEGEELVTAKPDILLKLLAGVSLTVRND